MTDYTQSLLHSGSQELAQMPSVPTIIPALVFAFRRRRPGKPPV